MLGSLFGKRYMNGRASELHAAKFRERRSVKPALQTARLPAVDLHRLQYYLLAWSTSDSIIHAKLTGPDSVCNWDLIG